jgi:hypothetical protein
MTGSFLERDAGVPHHFFFVRLPFGKPRDIIEGERVR